MYTFRSLEIKQLNRKLTKHLHVCVVVL